MRVDLEEIRKLEARRAEINDMPAARLELFDSKTGEEAELTASALAFLNDSGLSNYAWLVMIAEEKAGSLPG